MKYFNIYAALIMLIFKYSLGHHHRERIYFPDEIVGVPEASSTDYFNDQDKGEAVTPPEHDIDYVCGSTYFLGKFEGILPNGTGVPLYYLNKTAERLSSEGFKIFDEVVFGDVLNNFTYSNREGTFVENIAYTGSRGVAAAGGTTAAIVRGFYMAQIGEKTGDNVVWLCDGVLINRQWILSAAHCFTFPGINPNIIRLGDFNTSEPVEKGFNFWGKFTEDYPIEEIVPYPEFKLDQRYHDLILLKLPREFPRLHGSIKPICLPWDNETNRDLIGTKVVLSGWGATRYGDPRTDQLQEVELEVFDSKICNDVYVDLPGSDVKFPHGMTNENILCIGTEEGGKDACKGDSGAPVVYYHNKTDHFVLAGIVSGGYGCGLKEYPGLYIPINKPKYLRWIKEVAFKEYI